MEDTTRGMNMRALLLLRVPLLALCSCATTAPREGVVTAADGLSVSYEVRGAGSPALLFIHGWCCDRTFWDRQVGAFANEHRVVAVDLGGHGKSGIERESWTIDRLAGDASAVIAHEDLEEVVLVGHSMGGPVALKVAEVLPARVIGVIGVDSLQDAEFEVSEEMAQGAILALEEDFPRRCAAMSRGMIGSAASPELAGRIVTSMSEGPPEVAIALMRDFLVYDGRRGLSRAGVPVVCINAVSERFPTDVEANRRYAPGFEVIEMDGVGHFLMLEKPEEFNVLLADAIRRIVGQRQGR